MDGCLHYYRFPVGVNTDSLLFCHRERLHVLFPQFFICPPPVRCTLIMSSIFWCCYKRLWPPQSPIVVSCCHILYFLAFLAICQLFNFNSSSQSGMKNQREKCMCRIGSRIISKIGSLLVELVSGYDITGFPVSWSEFEDHNCDNGENCRIVFFSASTPASESIPQQLWPWLRFQEILQILQLRHLQFNVGNKQCNIFDWR